EQRIDTLTGQQLAALAVQRHGTGAAAFPDVLEPLAQEAYLFQVMGHVAFEGRAGRIDLRLQDLHMAPVPSVTGERPYVETPQRSGSRSAHRADCRTAGRTGPSPLARSVDYGD